MWRAPCELRSSAIMATRFGRDDAAATAFSVINPVKAPDTPAPKQVHALEAWQCAGIRAFGT